MTMGGLLIIDVLGCSGGWGAAKPQAVSRCARFILVRVFWGGAGGPGLVSPPLLVVSYHLVDWVVWSGVK